MDAVEFLRRAGPGGYSCLINSKPGMLMSSLIKKSANQRTASSAGARTWSERSQPIRSRSPVLWKANRSMWVAWLFTNARPAATSCPPVRAKLKLIAMSKWASDYSWGNCADRPTPCGPANYTGLPQTHARAGTRYSGAVVLVSCRSGENRRLVLCHALTHRVTHTVTLLEPTISGCG